MQVFTGAPFLGLVVSISTDGYIRPAGLIGTEWHEACPVASASVSVILQGFGFVEVLS